MADIHIVDLGSYIEITDITTVIPGVEVLKPFDAEITNASISIRDFNKTVIVVYATVSVPASVDIVDLRDQLMLFNNITPAPVPVGGATAANQVLEIAELNLIDASVNTLLTQAAFQSRINVLGQNTMANSTPIVIASNQSSIPVTAGKSATSTITNLAASAINQTLLVANALRNGATIYNSSTTAILYVKLGLVASAIDYSLQIQFNGYYEVPFGYTGNISGIWVAVTGISGAALVNEITT